jgi:putative membrane fusion protein
MDSDFDKIEKDIDSIVYTMQYSIQNDEFYDMEKYENQLRGLLDRKKEILDKKESASKYLEQLYNQEEAIENQLKEWKVEITTPESGIISFGLDGLENIITPNDIDYLTVEQYLAFRDHKALELDKESSYVDVPLFKIVVPDKWYIVSLIPHKNTFYEQGDTLNLKIPGLSEETISAKVYKVDCLKDSTLVILEIIENIESVIEARYIHIEIGISAEGLMVPAKAIINKNHRTGVKIERNGDIKFIEVKVKAFDDDWAIIEKVNDNDTLDLNDIVIIK